MSSLMFIFYESSIEPDSSILSRSVRQYESLGSRVLSFQLP